MDNLADKAAIYDAAVTYAVGADRRDKAMWAKVLTEDCVIEGPGFSTQGREQCLANLDYLGYLYERTQHRISNQIFTIDGDTAEGETYGTADHVRVDGDKVDLVAWSLRYQDKLVREDGQWRFARRSLIVDWEEVRPLARVGRNAGLEPVGGGARDERLDVAQHVYLYATAIDTRDWDLHSSIFADEVQMDFESWDGIPAYRASGRQIAGGCRVYFAGLDATQHSMSNPRVTIEGDRARCVVYMQAEHFLDGADGSKRFVIGGYYTDELVRTEAGWKITAVKLTVLWTEGDRSIMEGAGELGVARLQEA